MCAHMFATFEDTPDPAKLRMQYWGAASYLQTGSELWNIWTCTPEHEEGVIGLSNKYKPGA